MTDPEMLTKTLIALVEGMQRVERLVGPDVKTSHEDLRNELTALKTRFDEHHQMERDARGERQADRARIANDVEALRGKVVLMEERTKAIADIKTIVENLAASDQRRKGERGVIAAILRSPLSRYLPWPAGGSMRFSTAAQ